MALIAAWLGGIPAAHANTTIESGSRVPLVYAGLPEFFLRGVKTTTPPAITWKAGGPPTVLEIHIADKSDRLELIEPLATWPGQILAFVEKTAGPLVFPSAPQLIPPITQEHADFWSLIHYTTPAASGSDALSPEQALTLADSYLLFANEARFGYDPSLYFLTARAAGLCAYAEAKSPNLHDQVAARLAVVLTLQGEGAELLALTNNLKLDPISQAWVYFSKWQTGELEKMAAAEPNEFYRKLTAMTKALNEQESTTAYAASAFKATQKVDRFYLWLIMGEGSISAGRFLERTQPVESWERENHSLKNWIQHTTEPFDEAGQASRIEKFVTSRSDNAIELILDKSFVAFFVTMAKTEHDTLCAQAKESPERPAWALTDPEIAKLSQARLDTVMLQKFNFYFSRWGVSKSIQLAELWQTINPKSQLAPIALELARNQYGTQPWAVLTSPDALPRENRPLAALWISRIKSVTVLGNDRMAVWHQDQPAEGLLTLIATNLTKYKNEKIEVWNTYMEQLKRYPFVPTSFYFNVISRAFNSAHMEKGLSLLNDGATLRRDDAGLNKLYISTLLDHKRDWPKILEASNQALDHFPDECFPYVYGILTYLAWGKPQEAIDWSASYEKNITGSLALAEVREQLVKAYIRKEAWQTALELVAKSDRVGSWSAMNATIQANLAASNSAPAFDRTLEMLDRYESLPVPVLPLLEAPGSSRLVPTIGDHLLKMTLHWDHLHEFLETLDHLGRTGELKASQLQPLLDKKNASYTLSYIALCRRDGNFEAAEKAVADGLSAMKFQGYAYQNLILERDRAVARNNSLSPLPAEGFLTSAEVIGPFRNWRGEAWGKVYPPETEYEPGKSYEGASGEIVRWKKWSVLGCSPLWYPTGFIQDRSASWSAYYLRFTIPGPHAPTPRKLQFFFGFDAARSELFFNGVSLGKAQQKELTKEITLQPGNNILLVKICGGSFSPQISARLLPQ